MSSLPKLTMDRDVLSMLLVRFDRIDSRLDKQDVILEEVKKQTTMTNGRVTSLEKLNAQKIIDAATTISTRRWFIETLIKLAPWIGMLISIATLAKVST